MRRRTRVFDQQGRYLGETDTPGWGASFYELTHPFTVQDEYAAVGKARPSVSEVVDSALTNISQSAGETIGSIQRTGKLIVVAVIVIGVAYVATKFTGRKRR
jgi:hypothetical protein